MYYNLHFLSPSGLIFLFPFYPYKKEYELEIRFMQKLLGITKLDIKKAAVKLPLFYKNILFKSLNNTKIISPNKRSSPAK